MERINELIMEFLMTEKECILYTNEVGFKDVMQLAKGNHILIANATKKLFRAIFDTSNSVHYIEYVEDIEAYRHKKYQ